MPTAAKLVAAFLLAALGYIASEMIKPLVPQTTDFGWFTYLNAAIGLLCGWIIVGPRAGRGLSAGVSNGLTGGAALVFWGVLAQAVNEMVRLAFARQIKAIGDAFTTVFELMLDYGAILLDGPLILTLVAGAVGTGLAAEFAARRWR